MDHLVQTITLGLIATLIMDALAWIRFYFYSTPAFNYAFGVDGFYH